MMSNNLEKARIFSYIGTGAFLDEDIYKMEKAYSISILYYEKELKEKDIEIEHLENQKGL